MGGEKQRVGELGTEMEDKVHLLIWRVEATDEIDVRTRVLQAAIAERERERELAPRRGIRYWGGRHDFAADSDSVLGNDDIIKKRQVVLNY